MKRNFKYRCFGLLAGLLLILASSGKAQDTSQLHKRSIVKINAFQLFAGEVRLSYEQQIAGQNSIEGTIGFYHKYTLPYLIGEAPAYIPPDKRYGGKLQLSYLIRFSQSQNSYFLKPLLFYKYLRVEGECLPFPCISYDEVVKKIQKQVGAVELLLGYTINHQDKVVWEPYIGLGGRFKYRFVRDVDYTGRTPPNNYPDNYIERLWRPTFHLGLDIGFKLVKN